MKVALRTKVSICRGTVAISARPRSRTAARRSFIVPQANMFTDVSKYMSDAAAQIFSPMNDDVPWERVAEPFAGRIAHHEEVTRLRHLADEVRAAREQLEKTVAEVPDVVEAVDVDAIPASPEYITEAIDRVFGHNFKGDASEPTEYFGGGYRSPGRTQREVRREIDRLRRFEKVVTTAIETAKVKN